jgi:uncharacterized membrane protein
MFLTAKSAVIVLAAVSGLAMVYVGAYQIRAIEHMSCPLPNQHARNSCEAVADAPFARPFGIPDGFLAAGIYGVVIVLAVLGSSAPGAPLRYSIRTLVVLAALANGLGVFDMKRLGAWCFYCLLTTALSPVLVWAALLY